MDDDFNTPEAIAVLFDIATKSIAGSVHAAALLKSLGTVLGLLQRDRRLFAGAQSRDLMAWSDWLDRDAVTGISEAQITRAYQGPADAKKAKNFAEADRIRDELRPPASSSRTGRAA